MISFIANKIAQSRTNAVQNQNQQGRINTATKPYANDCFVRSAKPKTEAQPSFGASLKVTEREAFFMNRINKLVSVIEEKLQTLPVEDEFEHVSDEVLRQKQEVADHFTDLAKTYIDLEPHSVLCRKNALNSAVNAVNFVPEHPEANYICGNLEGDPKEAFKFYTIALKGDPKNPEYLMSRAMTAKELKDKKTAISDLKTLIALDPKNPESYIQKGYVHQEFNENEEALAEFDKAIALDPQNYRGYGAKGYTLFAMDDFEGSAKNYEKSISLNPPNDELGMMRSNMGTAYLRTQNYPKSIEAYTLALETAYHPGIFFDRGLCHFLLGNYENAISDAKMAQKTGAGDLSTVAMQVVSLRNLNRHEEADKLLGVAEDSYPMGDIDFRAEIDNLVNRKETYSLLPKGENK